MELHIKGNWFRSLQATVKTGNEVVRILLVDPAVDLAAEPLFALRRRWIVELTEKLFTEPWTVPLDEWEHQLSLDLPSQMQTAAKPSEQQRPCNQER